ncbi:MAG: hypothetical protein AAF394_13495 [Planctomycetota bacterium]
MKSSILATPSVKISAGCADTDWTAWSRICCEMVRSRMEHRSSSLAHTSISSVEMGEFGTILCLGECCVVVDATFGNLIRHIEHNIM